MKCSYLFSQTHSYISPNLLNQQWNARWITSPENEGGQFEVIHFRKTFWLNSLPEEFIIHVSADNRYKLFINAQYVCYGSEYGDLLHWRFESLDISPYLNDGNNIIAAVVWNFANRRPVAQFSKQTAFIVQGNTLSEQIINTDASWKVIRNLSYSSVWFTYPSPGISFIIGANEHVDASMYPWGWQHLNYSDNSWSYAKELEHGTPERGKYHYGQVPNWLLMPRQIPFMEETTQRFNRVARTNLSSVYQDIFHDQKTALIPENSEITILVDQGYLTTAYPILEISNGKNSEIKITYAEALYNYDEQKNL